MKSRSELERVAKVVITLHPQENDALRAQSDHSTFLKNNRNQRPRGRRNYASVAELSDKVVEVLDDQSTRGQVLRLSEKEARSRFSNLVAASSWSHPQKVKPLLPSLPPSRVVTARVLFDGTNGISINTRTRMRTFALTADVSEDHRQAQKPKEDWHLLECQVQPGPAYVHTVGTIWRSFGVYCCSRVASAPIRLTLGPCW